MARDVDDGSLEDGVLLVALWCYLHALRPLAGGSIRAQQNQKRRDGHNQDTRDNERDPPGHVWSESLLLYEGVVDGWHGKVGNAAASISEASSNGVCSANNVLVEEACRPDLARHEATTKNADEESQRIQLVHIVCCARQESWDGSDEKTSCECVSRTESIASRASDETDEQSCNQSDDV